MKLPILFLGAALLLAAGCSKEQAKRQGPVSITGKLTQAGQPVGNVVVTFRPLDNGFEGSFPVKPDGAFAGELVAGNYAYFVAKSTAPNADAALKKVDPKFYEPDLTRSVVIEPGKEVLIAL
jgi:hypothetical protein